MVGFFCLRYRVEVLHTIQHMSLICLRCIFAVVGVTLLYMAMFMYEDERGNQQNRLVSLWITVKQREEKSLNSQTVLLKQAARLASVGLERILGKSLFSLWTFVVSASLSLASVFFVRAATREIGDAPRYLLIFGAVFLLYGLIVAPELCRRGNPGLAVTSLVVVCAIAIACNSWVLARSYGFSFSQGLQDSTQLVIPIFAVCVAFGVCCDVLILAVNRVLVDSMATSSKGITLAFGVLYNLIWSVVLADTLRLIKSTQVDRDPLSHLISSLSHSTSVWESIFRATLITYAMSTNVFTLLASLSVFIVTLFALMHRLLWPVLGRLINAMYEWKILTSRTVQLSVGLACLVFAIPQFGALLKHFQP